MSSDNIINKNITNTNIFGGRRGSTTAVQSVITTRRGSASVLPQAEIVRRNSTTTASPIITRRGSINTTQSPIIGKTNMMKKGSPFGLKRKSSLKRSNNKLSKTTTTIRIHYNIECNDDIYVYGSDEGLSWDYGYRAERIEENGEGVWIVALPVIAPHTTLFFKPVFNNEFWAKGSDYTMKAGETVDIHPFFFADKGEVFVEKFTSKVMGDERKISIYIPPSYDENLTKKYHVMVMQDGHNLFDPSESFCGDTWKLKEAMDKLCVEKGIEEQIIVGVYPVKRHYEYLPYDHDNEGGGAEKYLDMIQKELIPWVSSNLRVKNSKNVGIGGSSYGGIICMYAWLTRPELFDLCGCFSPSCEWKNEALTALTKKHLKQREDHHKLYLDWGTIMDEGEAAQVMSDYIEKTGHLSSGQYKKVIAEGHEHTERHWAMRSPAALAYLFADPHRVQVEEDTEERAM